MRMIIDAARGHSYPTDKTVATVRNRQLPVSSCFETPRVAFSVYQVQQRVSHLRSRPERVQTYQIPTHSGSPRVTDTNAGAGIRPAKSMTMNTDTNDTDKHNATSHSTRNSGNEDIQPTAVDLTKFQVRILAILAADDRYGLAIKRALEDYYGEEVNHGRLYPNLDKLIDQDLVEKSELDKRTNNYSVTDRGRRALAYETEWLEEKTSEDGE